MKVRNWTLVKEDSLCSRRAGDIYLISLGFFYDLLKFKQQKSTALTKIRILIREQTINQEFIEHYPDYDIQLELCNATYGTHKVKYLKQI